MLIINVYTLFWHFTAEVDTVRPSLFTVCCDKSWRLIERERSTSSHNWGSILGLRTKEIRRGRVSSSSKSICLSRREDQAVFLLSFFLVVFLSFFVSSIRGRTKEIREAGCHRASQYVYQERIKLGWIRQLTHRVLKIFSRKSAKSPLIVRLFSNMS